MFFCKHVFTNFFYLKKQNTFISTFSFDAIDFFEDYISEDVEEYSEDIEDTLSRVGVDSFSNLKNFKNIFFYLNKFFFSKFFLFFFQNFFYFSFYFFQNFFFNSFFFKFVKFISFFVFIIFDFFLKKNSSLKSKNIFFFFCSTLKNFLTTQDFFQIDLSILLDFLKLDYWDVPLPKVPFLLFRDNSFYLKFLKSFSFLKVTEDNSDNFLFSFLMKKITKKMIFFENFLKQFLYFFLRKYRKQDNYTKLYAFYKVFNSLKKRRGQRLVNFFLFFLKLQEDIVLKKKLKTTIADFSMENFLGFDLLNFSSFFFSSLNVLPSLRMPLIF